MSPCDQQWRIQRGVAGGKTAKIGQKSYKNWMSDPGQVTAPDCLRHPDLTWNYDTRRLGPTHLWIQTVWTRHCMNLSTSQGDGFKSSALLWGSFHKCFRKIYSSKRLCITSATEGRNRQGLKNLHVTRMSQEILWNYYIDKDIRA